MRTRFNAWMCRVFGHKAATFYSMDFGLVSLSSANIAIATCCLRCMKILEIK